jgi:hypothetical protein
MGPRFGRLVHGAIATLVAGSCASRAIGGDSGFGDGSGDTGDTGDGDGDGDGDTGTSGTSATSGTGTSATSGTSGDGDGDGDVTPPRLIDVERLDGQTVELTFSEPIRPADAVDPNKWRMSLAFHQQYGYGYQGATYYFDAGISGVGEYKCYEYCWPYYDPQYCEQWCYWEQTHVTVIDVSAHPMATDRARLHLSHAIGQPQCDWVDGWSLGGEQAGFHVHYSNNGGLGIEDLAGNDLDAIAEHWNLQPWSYSEYVQGNFPAMPALLPIPCP